VRSALRAQALHAQLVVDRSQFEIVTTDTLYRPKI
jgi:hypothetical protein